MGRMMRRIGRGSATQRIELGGTTVDSAETVQGASIIPATDVTINNSTIKHLGNLIEIYISADLSGVNSNAEILIGNINGMPDLPHYVGGSVVTRKNSKQIGSFLIVPTKGIYVNLTSTDSTEKNKIILNCMYFE